MKHTASNGDVYIIRGSYGPLRFEFSHEDYDGPGDNRHGYGATAADCIERIEEQIEDEEWEVEPINPEGDTVYCYADPDPIGTCSNCGTPVYIEGGFCGRCN